MCGTPYLSQRMSDFVSAASVRDVNPMRTITRTAATFEIVRSFIRCLSSSGTCGLYASRAFFPAGGGGRGKLADRTRTARLGVRLSLRNPAEDAMSRTRDARHSRRTFL